jgi:hypothetical protein
MTMNPKSRRCLARCLRRFSTGHARARANLELSSQTIQEPSLFNIGCSDRPLAHAQLLNRPWRSIALPRLKHTICGQIPIAPAAPPLSHFLRFRALALFGRRPHQSRGSLANAGVRKPCMGPIGVKKKLAMY